MDTRAPEFSDKSMPVFYPKVSLSLDFYSTLIVDIFIVRDF